MKVLFFVFLLSSFAGFSQDISLEKEEIKKMEFAGVYKCAINLEGGGKTGFVGLSYDYLLSRRWRVGVGLGYPGVGADVKFYPTGVKRFKPVVNLGLRSTAFFPNNGTAIMAYSLPIGISFFGPSRVNIELDAGPMLKYPINNGEAITGISDQIGNVWVSIKIGHRFSFYAMKRARELNRLEE